VSSVIIGAILFSFKLDKDFTLISLKEERIQGKIRKNPLNPPLSQRGKIKRKKLFSSLVKGS